MSQERLIAALDQIRSHRNVGIPLYQRIPNYLQAAREAFNTPGVRIRSVDFVCLAAKGTMLAVYQSAVQTLEANEAKITSAIEITGDAITRGLGTIRGSKG